MEVSDFEERVYGETIDISMRHKEVTEKAILYRVESMPYRDTLVRLGNEVSPVRGEIPCYLQAKGDGAIDIGFVALNIDKINKCLSILGHTKAVAYWVNGGVVGEEITNGELMYTVKYKKGGDIGEVV